MPEPLLRPMRARDVGEAHRASTPLELFFDLTFVVAVSFAAVGLAHEISAGHAARGTGLYALIFFAIWWGWVNFTWFASAYDTDDWLYRVVTIVQMGGALTVAAGVPKAYARDDFTVVVVGYVIMRVAMVCQWLRAGRNDPPRRGVARRYAAGIVILQALWAARLALPSELDLPSFLILVLGELAVPILAERGNVTSFHPGHIAERYGLFTIIVLGEGVLASGNSVIEALQAGQHLGQLITLAVAGLVLLAGMWWLYFAGESAEEMATFGRALRWGYGHYVVFAAAAAVSSGIEVQVGAITEPGHVSHLAARLSLGVPVTVFVLAVWVLVLRPRMSANAGARSVLAAAALFGSTLLPLPPAASTGLAAGILGLLVAYLVASRADSLDVARSSILRNPTGSVPSSGA